MANFKFLKWFSSILVSFFISIQAQANILQDSIDQIPLPLIDILVDVEEFNHMILNYSEDIEIEAKLELIVGLT